MKPTRYTVAVDFDGVLHRYDSPWVDHHVIPDEAVDGAIAWLCEIVRDFDVVIFTTRGKTEAGQRACREWIEARGGPVGLPVTAEKPPALVYVDDRAWRFDGRFPSASEIHNARPWNKPRVVVTP